MRTALVVGGTGPTGPIVVEGLLERGYDVTILHGGQHENPDVPEVPHIHADPHFAETLAPAAVEGRTFDLVAAQYGRLRVLVDVFRGRTAQLIAIGASTGMAAGPADPRWNRLGRPALLTEDRVIPAADEVSSTKFALRMAQAQDHLFAAHADGAFSATYLGYPVLYGPHQPGPQDWSIVRRALDGRRRLVIADGGLKLETRGYTRNVARSVLLAADSPDVAAGKSYIVCDPHTYTMTQRIALVAAVCGVEFELVDLPWEHARPAHPLWRYEQGHRLSDSGLIRRELGYTDELPVDEALAASVEWMLAHPFERGGPEENQLGDPFDYEGEDRVMAAASRPPEPYELPGYAHQYRHPKKPGEAWRRVEGAMSPTGPVAQGSAQ
ncbi:NAD(P)H-binding protein [Pseudonocardia ailaonensis]|uniref:NAD(P)H-binding protein n=1 Tax=Pseudonocardia ailaonensis TaxID=367279 RepID=A0ABN2N8B1_9PSEU